MKNGKKKLRDDNMLLRDFKELYQSMEIAEQLWAIDQIPLADVRNSSIYVSDCFKFFSEHISMEEGEIIQALHDAINRELITPVLTFEVRLNYIYPIIIKCISGRTPGEWIHLLHRMFTLITEDIYQSIAFEKVNQLLNEHTVYSTYCAVHMIAGLCEAGAMLPTDIINQLVSRPHVLKHCYKPVIEAMMESQSDLFITNTLEKIISTSLSIPTLFNSVITMKSIHPVIMQWIKKIVQSKCDDTELLCVIARNFQTLIKLGIISEAQVIQMIWKSSLFTPQYFDTIANFYLSFMEFYPSISEKDNFSLLKRICQSGNRQGVKLIRCFLKSKPSAGSMQFVIEYLSLPISFAILDEWCLTYKECINMINSEGATTLTSLLIKYLTNEIRVGHIYTKKRKKIINEKEPKQKMKSTLYVKGWREISIMLEALSYSPIKWLIKGPCIKLMKEAIEVHSFPLVPSFISIIISLKSFPEAAFDFLTFLINGNSTKRLVLFKIIPEIINTFDRMDFVDNVGIPISQIAELCSSVNVRCAALGTLPLFIKLGRAFTETSLCSRCLSAYRCAENEKNNAIGEIINQYASEFRQMERLLNRGKENKDENENVVLTKPHGMLSRLASSKQSRISYIVKPTTNPKLYNK